MKNFVKHIVFITITVFLLIECNTPTKPITPVEKVPYMTLNIGDKRQYYNKTVNLYFEWNIIDTTKRSDGQKVFVAQYILFLPDGRYESTDYFFIRDNYFWQTEIDTIQAFERNVENPFLESKIINVYPKSDEYFLSTLGVPDSDKVFHKITIIDSLKTPLDTFKDVEECKVEDGDSSKNITLYYVKDYGHIATKITKGNDSTQTYTNYIKVGDKEIGKFVPLKEK